MTNDDFATELHALHEKVDRALTLLEDLKSARASRSGKKSPREKLPPLTDDEIKQHQARFSDLYSRWLQGQELDVQDELELLDVEGLRRFADANNLNVTSKMPKQRVLQLIGARFREKRQLHRGSSSNSNGT